MFVWKFVLWKCLFGKKRFWFKFEIWMRSELIWDNCDVVIVWFWWCWLMKNLKLLSLFRKYLICCWKMVLVLFFFELLRVWEMIWGGWLKCLKCGVLMNLFKWFKKRLRWCLRNCLMYWKRFVVIVKVVEVVVEVEVVINYCCWI